MKSIFASRQDAKALKRVNLLALLAALREIFNPMNLAPSRRLSPTMWQAGFLFGVDMVTNVADYGFHAYLGWALTPADFAVVQTINSALLIVVTAFAVLQPVVARYAAEAGSTTTGRAVNGRAIFQVYFRQSALLGLALTLAVWLGQRPLAAWLNVPATAVALSATMMLLALTRPVVAGMLQGQEQFVAFGATRSAFALGRLALAVLLIGVVGGASAGVAAIPLGGLLSLALGLWLLGRAVWQGGPELPRLLVWHGWRLSLAAFIAYIAYMGLLNIDLIWVNRTFPADLAGSYAAAVVLRRVLAVLPGAVIVILYPRIVSRVAQGHLPDGVLAKTAAVVVVANVLVTALYFAAGPLVVRLMFGPDYPAAAALLGWMGVAMIGYGIVTIWLNLFLATRPWAFVALLAATAVTQMALLPGAGESLLAVTAVFGLAGWFLAAVGLVLYRFWLRPRLRTTGD